MDYANGRIYQILNTVDDYVYVGSTTQPLSKRMAKHRKNMNSPATMNRPLYSKMRELGANLFYIELLEEFPCDNREQLNKREGHYIRQIGTLNGCVAGRTRQEHYNENLDKIIEYRNRYHKDNKDNINATRRNKFVCACGLELTLNSKSRHLRTQKHTDWLNNQSELPPS